MVSCGITKQFPISLHRPFLRATNARTPLKPACTIPCVVCCPYYQSLNLILFLSMVESNRADGLEYSLPSFGFAFGLCGLAMCIQAKVRNHLSIHSLKSETRSLLTIISSFSVQSFNTIFNRFDE